MLQRAGLRGRVLGVPAARVAGRLVIWRPGTRDLRRVGEGGYGGGHEDVIIDVALRPREESAAHSEGHLAGAGCPVFAGLAGELGRVRPGPPLVQRREAAAPSGGHPLLAGRVVHHELVDDLLRGGLVSGQVSQREHAGHDRVGEDQPGQHRAVKGQGSD